MKSRPPCSNCVGGGIVRTLGGGTHGKYRYFCEECENHWQEVPPHLVTNEIGMSGGHLSSAIQKTRPSSNRRGSSYKCGRCGEPKRGHICKISTTQDNPTTTSAKALHIDIPMPAPVQNSSILDDELTSTLNSFDVLYKTASSAFDL